MLFQFDQKQFGMLWIVQRHIIKFYLTKSKVIKLTEMFIASRHFWLDYTTPPLPLILFCKNEAMAMQTHWLSQTEIFIAVSWLCPILIKSQEAINFFNLINIGELFMYLSPTGIIIKQYCSRQLRQCWMSWSSVLDKMQDLGWELREIKWLLNFKSTVIIIICVLGVHKQACFQLFFSNS